MTSSTIIFRIASILVGFACLAGSGGCRSTSKMNLLGKRHAEDGTVPQNIVALWKDDVMAAPGAPAERGLGGRLYFYDETNHPVPVQGKLVVYAYDDSAKKQLNREPERKYVFDDEDLQKHFSESEVGPSYSVWLPWDKAGVTHAEVSLIPMLTTKDGKVIIGEHSRHVLGGKDVPPSTTEISQRVNGSQSDGPGEASIRENAADRMSPLQPVGYEERVETAPKRSLRSTSIRLPHAVKERLARSSELTDGRLERRRQAISTAVQQNPNTK